MFGWTKYFFFASVETHSEECFHCIALWQTSLVFRMGSQVLQVIHSESVFLDGGERHDVSRVHSHECDGQVPVARQEQSG